MHTSELNSNSSELITHHPETSFSGIDEHIKRLQSASDLTLSLEEELSLLNQLTEFGLGRFLLVNKGLNGYWTHYVMLTNVQNLKLRPLEKWLLTRAPAVKATQERFHIFQKHLHKHLQSNIKVASIPCGLMDDLLSLDYSCVSNVSLTGIDLDKESLKLAQENAVQNQVEYVQFSEKNAWDLKSDSEYDIITSNGLNVYVTDLNAEINLYKEFYKALKKDGIFITSFLTPGPMQSENSPWKNYDVSDLLKQKAVFSDILQVNWQTMKKESEIRKILEGVGFKILAVDYDSAAMFPTIICKKK